MTLCRSLPLLFFLLTATVTGSAAQEPRSGDPLTLRVLAGPRVHGLPIAFRYILRNRSHHELRLPVPSIKCVTNDGSIHLQWLFQPVDPLEQTGLAPGCGSGMGQPPILERIRTWCVLKPGSTFTLSVSSQQLHLNADIEGDYDMWAEYRPPDLLPDDEHTLAAAGIFVPRKRLSSPHLFLKTHL